MRDTPNLSKDILIILPSTWNLARPACRVQTSVGFQPTVIKKGSLLELPIPEISYAFFALIVTIGAAFFTSKGQTS
jgi:hypothetical protein